MRLIELTLRAMRQDFLVNTAHIVTVFPLPDGGSRIRLDNPKDVHADGMPPFFQCVEIDVLESIAVIQARAKKS